MSRGGSVATLLYSCLFYVDANGSNVAVPDLCEDFRDLHNTIYDENGFTSMGYGVFFYDWYVNGWCDIT